MSQSSSNGQLVRVAVCVASLLAASASLAAASSPAPITAPPPAPPAAPAPPPAAVNPYQFYGSNNAYYTPSNNYPGANATTSPACVQGTLASYQSLGFGGCTIGAVTFYNFTSNKYFDTQPNPVIPENGGYTTLDPTLLIITPNTDPADPTLGFLSSQFDNSLGLSAETYTLEYYIDPPIDLLGYGLRDDPFTSTATYVQANICTNSQFSPYSQYTNYETEEQESEPQDCVYGPLDPEISLDYTNYQQGVSTPFDAGTQFADVQLKIHVDAGDNLAFSASVPTVAEPEVLGLAGIGGLALVGASLGKRRRRGQGVAA